jgi:3-oxoacyl-[acyl-carrier-protein] synthase III
MLDVTDGQPPAHAGRAGTRTASLLSLSSVPGSLTVRNATVADRMGVTEQWIMKRIGVRERRVAPPDQQLFELAADAGRQALESARVDAAMLDLVIVATCTHDHIMPSAAAFVGAELGATRAGTMDLNSVCNGFISAVAMAASSIEAERAETVLVIAADVLSRWVDPTDRRTAPMFGDGAGAVVLGSAEGRARIGDSVLRSDGSGVDLIRCTRDSTMCMAGEETYRRAVARLSEVTLEILERGGLAIADVDLFVYHQANARILKALGERLGAHPDRVVNAMTSVGNTTAASIPLALAAAERQGRLHQGALVLAGGFGSGLSYGALLMEWGEA